MSVVAGLGWPVAPIPSPQPVGWQGLFSTAGVSRETDAPAGVTGTEG